MIVGSQLESAQLENKATNPAAQAEGLIYYNTTNKKPAIDDGVDVSEIQLEKHLETTLDSKNLKGKVAARDTYANLLALPRVAGLLYEATDLGSILFDDGTNLNEIGGAGNGSVNTFHQQIFETKGEGYFSTIDGSWTKEDETTTPLRGTRSVKFTQVAGSLGARQVSEIIELEEDQKGSECGHFFRYKTSNSDYYEVTIEESDDGSTFTKVPNSRELNLAESKRSAAIYYIPKETSTHVRLSFEVLAESIGHELIVDSIEATTKPLQTIEFDYTRDSVEYSPTVDIVGTVTSSQAFYCKVANKAKFTGQIAIGSTASGNLNVSLPDNLLIDTSKLPTTNSSFGKLGEARWYNASAPSNGQKLWVCYNADDKVFFKEEDGTPFDGTFLDNGDSIYYDFEAPIQGWTANGSGVVTEGQLQNEVLEKILSTTVSISGDVSDLQFDGLEVGKWYEVTGQVAMDSQDVDKTELDFFSGASRTGQQYGQSRYDPSPSSSTGINTQGVAFKFKAESNTMYSNAVVNANNQVTGNGAKSATYLQLQKLNTKVSVISPFKTEIATGQEYKTGEVINGKDVYEYVHEVSTDITSDSTIVNIGANLNPVGHTNYAKNLPIFDNWLISNGHYTDSFQSQVYYDRVLGDIKVSIQGTYIVGAGTIIRFKYTK